MREFVEFGKYISRLTARKKTSISLSQLCCYTQDDLGPLVFYALTDWMDARESDELFVREKVENLTPLIG